LLEWKLQEMQLSDSSITPTFSNGISFVGYQLDQNLPLSAALTLVPLLPCDELTQDDEIFPPGEFDEHSEPKDMRESTSWNQSADEISMVELVEVQTINSTVPFMLISQLLPLMKKAVAEGSNLEVVHPIPGVTKLALVIKKSESGVDETPQKDHVEESEIGIEVTQLHRAFVVNVTSIEGVFRNKRSGLHPHTNMAKAALNMLTKSIANQYANLNIFVTAVDTGWVSKMSPYRGFNRERPPAYGPLSEADGAARVSLIY